MQAVEFYKAWDLYGTLSNFSPHPVMMPESTYNSGGQAQNGSGGGPMRRWQTLEHYYQAQKFAGEQAVGSLADRLPAEIPYEWEGGVSLAWKVSCYVKD